MHLQKQFLGRKCIVFQTGRDEGGFDYSVHDARRLADDDDEKRAPHPADTDNRIKSQMGSSANRRLKR